MMIHTSVFIAASLDGFIARRDGTIDWLDEANSMVPEGEDCGFLAFMKSIDTLVMGCKTYEQVLSFGQWPYNETPVVVMSHNHIDIPRELGGKLSQSSDDPRQLLDTLAEKGVERVYVDGGNTIQRFLSEELINEITITSIPVVIGEGISLFGNIGKDIRLTHKKTIAYDFGFVQTTYSVKKTA